MIDVLITHVYDTCRFKHYMKIKFNCDAGIRMAKDMNHGYHVRLNNLPECDVMYLQQYVCTLKIIKYTPMRPRIKPASSVNGERKRCIDISPQPGNEPKQEPLELFHVTFTKIIHYDEMLNERQIQALLKDNHVKSINIDK